MKCDFSGAARLAVMTLLATTAAVDVSSAAAPKPLEAQRQTDQSDAVLDSAKRKETVESLAKALEADYVSADAGRKMAQLIRGKLAAKSYGKITSPVDFASQLTADIRSVVNDRHMHVSYGAGPMMMRGSPEQMRAQNGAVRAAQILPGNVGYLEVNAFPPPPMAKDAVAAAFAFLRNTDALIIDLRGNGGGVPETVAIYMSYLSEGAPYVVNAIQYRDGRIAQTKTSELGELTYGARKPVFVATSHRTFSGGEELSYDIKWHKRGTLVGETTGGGANPTAPRPLVHGFSASIPFGTAVHPVTGTNWEGVGVKPDVEIAAELAVVEAHRLAVNSLIASATDANARAGLETLSVDLQTQLHAQGAVPPNRLTNAQLIGLYASATGPGPKVTEQDGILLLAPLREGALQFPLIPLGGDRYRLGGHPSDFLASFSEKNGKIQLMQHMGSWPPMISERR